MQDCLCLHLLYGMLAMAPENMGFTECQDLERLAKRIKTQKQIKYKHFNKLQLWKIQLKLQLVK